MCCRPPVRKFERLQWLARAHKCGCVRLGLLCLSRSFQSPIFSDVARTNAFLAALMSSVYEEHKDSDGFLCAFFPCVPRLLHFAEASRNLPDITYSGENTFGSAWLPAS